ncbi:acetylxylan esterase [Pararcticibacter amylolyticus]|uniref:Acetylxylan esterase n=1 Tax=Pararcticibacter amylolyticus TaxID=2173175 RepID=A0A2U2PHV5_9SPHI|nr:acetylxylan esterase [Pararcticibacter amylolyticus]PWG80844.1 acetylxylan esterase [Pararcticibacter amylolyticus]
MKGRFFISLLLLIFSGRVSAQNAAAPVGLVDFVLSPDSENWLYPLNQNASVSILVLKYGLPLKGAVIDYEYGPEMFPVDKKGSLTLKQGTAKIDIGSCSKPGFRQLSVKTVYDGKVYRGAIKLGWEPEKIQPTVSMPADFMRFWNKETEGCRKVPLDPELTFLKEYSTPDVDVYLVKIHISQGGKAVYGYLCKPKGAGKYPVLFSPPGAGIKGIAPSVFYAKQGFISFTTEIHGISPLLDAATYKEISNAFGDYWYHHISNRDEYYYKDVYLGCVRSVDFLCSLPEFDGKNVVVTGGSQGGALSIVTAALNKRVTCLAAFYPALCDLTGYLHGRAGGWPHIFSPKNSPVTDRPENIKCLAYYDVVNFAKNISVPGFYSWGYNDNTCPPTSIYAAVNSIPVAKTVVITPITGHWRFEETNQQSVDWIRSQLKKLE